ncbi:MAG: outer membrane lipoprotein carrier protein LolA [Burkholderiales bacterium]|nr:outer membrane lipoprotein carrier protein LolA [Burkholderiales bacterium]
MRLSWAFLIGALIALPAHAFDLPELMAQLRQRQSGEARFTEQRFVSGLDQVLRSSGTLSFTAPDRLARITELPKPESFVVEGARVTLERGGRRRQMAIDAMPELAAFVAAIRGTLAGDAAVLRQYFQPSVAGSAGRWTMTLQPLDPGLAAVVKQLRLEGQQADLRQVEVLLADGDRSLMLIEPLPAKAP